ncbi:MAG: S-layer family protein [Cyanobacteria bacterium P01_C01_bin.120]
MTNQLYVQSKLGVCRTCLSIGVTAGLAIASPAPAMAQTVTTDGTTGTVVNGAGPFVITGGNQQLQTLFHSFGEFSPGNASILFQLDGSQSAVDLVVGRVTGANVSFINGQLQLTGGNSPDLFLLNPNGISFGSGAELLLPGSFLATTAESVLFENGLEFSAIDLGSAPLLTVSAPTGLQMGQNPGDIRVSNTGHDLIGIRRNPIDVGTTPNGLQLEANHTLALIGRNLSLDGGILSAPDGQTYLGAVAAPDAVTLTRFALGWQPNYSGITQFGDITLMQQSLINAGNVGAVTLQGQTINLADGSVIFQENNTTQAAGSLTLQATDRIVNQGRSPNRLRSGIISDTQNAGQGGDIRLIAPQVLGGGGLGIRSYTYGVGRGGDVTIDATTIDLAGDSDSGALIAMRTLGTADTGTLQINTASLRLQSASLVNNINDGGTGNAGGITINASESVTVGPSDFSSTLIGSSSVSVSGNAGEITITTPRLTVQGGAFISSSTFGTGNAGRITINASEEISIGGEGVNFTTNAVEPTQIRTAGVLLPSTLRATLGLPNAVTGSSGDVVLNTNRLVVTDSGEVGVGHDDAGSGGSIQINANQVLLTNGGSLLASTQSGSGGDIQLNLGELLLMREGGLINTESLGTGNGGNITLNSPIVVGFENSDIAANAVSGNGGNIDITTQGIFGLEFRDELTPANDITASSQFGVNGTVTIDSPEVDPDSGIVELPAELADASNQIAAGCADTSENSFVATGRGGVPPTPGDDLGQPIWQDVRDLSAFAASEETTAAPPPLTASDDAITEITGWLVNEAGEVELVAATANEVGAIASGSCANAPL